MDFSGAMQQRIRSARRHAVGTLLAISASALVSVATPTRAQAPTLEGWDFCSNQYKTCSFSGTRDVRYGTATAFVVKTLTGPIYCSNALFGDPAVGAAKYCWLRSVAPPPPPPPPPPLPAVDGAEIGVYLGAGCSGRDRLAAYETWLGRPIHRVVDGLSNQSWDAMLSTAKWIAGCWQPTGKRMTITIPMLPNDGVSTLVAGASGAYDAHYRNIGQALVERGYAAAVVRIGPEMNGSWFRWNSLTDPQSWVRYWRSAVTAMRSVPGQQFKFDWCPGVGLGIASPEPAYPGDAYVDYIGADVYNNNYKNTPQPDRWNILRDAPVGLKWHATFAAAHNKPMSFPEWATGTRPDGYGGGDDPYFVRSMAAWIKANRVAYHDYWDYPASDYNGRLSDGSKPQSAQAYLESFGAPR